jgi:hypothetical protein
MELYLKQNEIIFLKTVCTMLEDNINNDSKSNISVYQIAKKSGVSYKTIRKNINKIIGL